MTSVGHRFFIKLCRSNLSSRIIAARFGSVAVEENARNVIPASQPGKIQAALLKDFFRPLVIENLEPPKNVQANEVSKKSKKKIYCRIIYTIYYLYLQFIIYIYK